MGFTKHGLRIMKGRKFPIEKISIECAKIKSNICGIKADSNKFPISDLCFVLSKLSITYDHSSYNVSYSFKIIDCSNKCVE